MDRHQYSCWIKKYSIENPYSIYVKIVSSDEYEIAGLHQDAWIYEIELLQKILKSYEGAIYFEYSIPRMEKGLMK